MVVDRGQDPTLESRPGMQKLRSRLNEIRIVWITGNEGPEPLRPMSMGKSDCFVPEFSHENRIRDRCVVTYWLPFRRTLVQEIERSAGFIKLPQPRRFGIRTGISRCAMMKFVIENEGVMVPRYVM